MGLKVKKWLTNSQFELRKEWQMVYRLPLLPWQKKLTRTPMHEAYD